MIFVGDIAHPFEEAPDWSPGSLPWQPQGVVGNLEGALIPGGREYLGRRLLFNDASVLKALAAINVRAVSLANNHITDLAGGIEATRALLRGAGIASAGAGATPEEAAAPVFLEEEGVQYALLAFGWETIQCRRARVGAPGVNPLEPAHVLESVERTRVTSGSAAVVVVMHWNYEMERYPQPAHRQLAMAAIEAGASAVIGHHPHCVAGLEFHRGCPIAYSLGNWWMPQGAYFAGRLVYPGEARLQLALEWVPHRQPTLHWFEYVPTDHRLVHAGSEPAGASERIRTLTPFAGLTHHEYKAWFRAHRIKRKALPIYLNYGDTARNRLKDAYVQARQLGVEAVSRAGLRRRPAQ